MCKGVLIWFVNEEKSYEFNLELYYNCINFLRSIPDRYLEKLSESNILTKGEGKSIVEKHTSWLAKALSEIDNFVPQPTYFTGWWSRLKQAESAVTTWNTGVDLNLLQFIANKSVHFKDSLVRF